MTLDVARIKQWADRLVWIDPEDKISAEHLAGLFLTAHRENGGAYVGAACDAMQAALREYADPPAPKPDEPQGLGAVIEDTDGEIYTRIGVHDGDSTWACKRTGNHFSWLAVDVASVLSEWWSA